MVRHVPRRAATFGHPGRVRHGQRSRRDRHGCEPQPTRRKRQLGAKRTSLVPEYAKEANVKLVISNFVARKPMQKPPLDPDVADTAPSDAVLTVYDEEHIITYLRLLDADAQGADWRAVARIVLHLDPEHESDRARRAFDSHLSRARWMTEHGYRHLLRGGASA